MRREAHDPQGVHQGTGRELPLRVRQQEDRGAGEQQEALAVGEAEARGQGRRLPGDSRRLGPQNVNVAR